MQKLLGRGLLVVACAVGGASAESIDGVGTCSSETAKPDAAIENCTTVIASGKFAGVELARAYFHRGRAWQLKADHGRAMPDFDEAVRLDPTFAAAYENRARAWGARGNRYRLLADLDAALRLEPERVPARLLRSEVLLNSMPGYFMNNGDVDRAIADLDIVIRLDPKSVKAHMLLGDAWEMKRDLDRALAAYDEAVRVDPGHGGARYGRGDLWYLKKDPDRAIADYDQAIRIDPKYAAPYIHRAVALDEKGENENSIKDLNQAISLNPRSSSAFLNRGLILFRQGDFDHAALDLEQSHRIHANINTAIWAFLAGARDGKPNASILTDLRKSANTAPTPDWPGPVVYFFTGRINAEELIARAKAPSLLSKGDMTCEAKFFVAQVHLIRNEREPAKRLLREVQESCKGNGPEYRATVADLLRMSI